MARTLLDRCKEVELFLQAQKAEKNLIAQALLSQQGEDKLQYVIGCLETELRMHQEVRKLWPYLLLIPDSEPTRYFCSMYESSLEQFGTTLDERICQVKNSLEVISETFGQAEVSAFWQAVREELIQQVCREAEIMLAQSG